MKYRDNKTSTVFIFVGVLLIVVFGVGLTKYRYDYTLESFIHLCTEWWIPAGIIGIPMFLISLILSLYRESKADKQERDS